MHRTVCVLYMLVPGQLLVEPGLSVRISCALQYVAVVVLLHVLSIAAMCTCVCVHVCVCNLFKRDEVFMISLVSVCAVL